MLGYTFGTIFVLSFFNLFKFIDASKSLFPGQCTYDNTGRMSHEFYGSEAEYTDRGGSGFFISQSQSLCGVKVVFSVGGSSTIEECMRITAQKSKPFPRINETTIQNLFEDLLYNTTSDAEFVTLLVNKIKQNWWSANYFGNREEGARILCQTAVDREYEIQQELFRLDETLIKVVKVFDLFNFEILIRANWKTYPLLEEIREIFGSSNISLNFHVLFVEQLQGILHDFDPDVSIYESIDNKTQLGPLTCSQGLVVTTGMFYINMELFSRFNLTHNDITSRNLGYICDEFGHCYFFLTDFGLMSSFGQYHNISESIIRHGFYTTKVIQRSTERTDDCEEFFGKILPKLEGFFKEVQDGRDITPSDFFKKVNDTIRPILMGNQHKLLEMTVQESYKGMQFLREYFDAIEKRVDDLEKRVKILEENNRELKKSNEELTKKVDKLEKKIDKILGVCVCPDEL